MEYHIRSYLDDLFASAPDTRRAYELKVELAENLIEKYNALLAEGKSEEDAYQITILSIGDVSELFDSLQEGEAASASVDGHPVQNRAAATAIAVMTYILSFLPVIFSDSSIAIAAMFLMWAAATGLLIYTNMSHQNYRPSDPDTVVSQFRNWQGKTSQDHQLRRALHLVLWSLVVAVYFLVSFATQKWYITWVLFPIGVAAEGVISAIFALRHPNGR